MDGGKFEMRDVPGMVPSDSQVRQMAETMARVMYPERFECAAPTAYGTPFFFHRCCGAEIGSEHQTGCDMVSQEDLAQHPDPFGERTIDPAEAAKYPNGEYVGLTTDTDPSPLSRLFAAVRAVIGDQSRVFDFTAEIDTEKFDELREAYDSLKLDG